MATRTWQVGLLGTFDVENYGDLLFPLVAEAELAERLGSVELHRFSYRAKTADTWPYPVTSVTELPRIAAKLDGLLIGGGHLVRFDKVVAPGYGPPTPAIHHPTGYWLTPALIALQHGIPLIWNAPGAAKDIPAWAGPLLELAFQHSSYIAVRDQPARATVERFVDRERVAVVPDTGFGVLRCLGPEPSRELERLRNAVGLSRPYVVLQAARGLDTFHRYLRRHADRLQGLQFLALPIGPALGDDNKIPDADLPGLIRLSTWPHPLLLAELIRQAEAVVGYSYHLAITALGCGVPVFARADLVAGKYAALEEFDTIYPLPDEGDADPGWFVSRLGRTDPSPLVGKFLGALAAHWDQVAAILRSGATDSRVAVGRFWQSLPRFLETAAIGCDEEVAALRLQSAAAVGALESDNSRAHERVAALSRLLELARGEIVARDSRIAGLRASTSWKITAPLRFVGRRLGR